MGKAGVVTTASRPFLDCMVPGRERALWDRTGIRTPEETRLGPRNGPASSPRFRVLFKAIGARLGMEAFIHGHLRSRYERVTGSLSPVLQPVDL